MKLQTRDIRALALLVVALILALLYRSAGGDAAPKVVTASVDPVTLAEKKLSKVRDAAATVQSKEAVLKDVAANLATREKGVMTAGTAAQAQAQLIQIVRRIGAAEMPPVEIRSTEIGPVRALGADYGEAVVSISVECRVDQLVNILAGLQAEPQLISASDLRVVSTGAKEKTVGARMTVSGVVPKKLVPAKSGGSR
ncbi:MAG: GspMb/PilO family protein [Bryobacteraceae bacterium]